MSKKNEYDVIIIGAGIGGLVCGCYLAKAGLSTLIVEKNAKPGGYCTSFNSNGFKFDAFVHSLGSLKKGKIIANVLDDLDIADRIKFKRYNPSDIVISPDFKIKFWNNLDKLIEEFQRNFPKESKNIKRFFTYLDDAKSNHVNLRKNTFDQVLNEYFDDYKLKAILSIFVLGNLGLPSSKISAFTAVKFYKQFMLDGGYYPENGMQELPNLLASRFEEFNGDLILSSYVKKILIYDNSVVGIELKNGKKFSSNNVVSNCDARQTFFELIGENRIKKNLIETLNKLNPSLSMVILYLGLDSALPGLPREGINTWILPHYDLDKMYNFSTKNNIKNDTWIMVRLLSDKRSLLVFASAAFKNHNYWIKNKTFFCDHFIKKAENIIPNLTEHINYRNIATPNTLHKLTLNYQGAPYGWESTPSQLAVPGLARSIDVKNLFLAGHWSALAQGIPGVTLMGQDVANIIVRKHRH